MFSAWNIQFRDFTGRPYRGFRYACPGYCQRRARIVLSRHMPLMLGLLISAHLALGNEQANFADRASIDRQSLLDEQQLVREQKLFEDHKLVGDQERADDQKLVGKQKWSDNQKLVDPTRPAGWRQKSAVNYSPQQRPEIRVDYIIHSRQRKMVSINGDHLQEGDRWQDISIIRIEPKKVLLAWRGQQWFTSITPNEGNNRNSMVIRRSK